MSKMMKKSLALIALLLATTTAVAQVPVLKKPVLATEVKPTIKPAIKPVIIPNMLKTPTTAVIAADIASNSPNREEAARRLKSQNIPVAAALAALRSAFGAGDGEEGRALRAAGYALPDLLAAIKQADGLDVASMFRRMGAIGISPTERGGWLRLLYAVDFDALLVLMRQIYPVEVAFGYALDGMDYNVQQMVETGYRYFNGRFLNSSNGKPYPGPGDLYSLLKYAQPIAEHLQVDHYALLVQMMSAGYAPVQIMQEIAMGPRDQIGRATDNVGLCVAQTNLVNDGRRPGSVNPALIIRIAPEGSATHSDVQRACYVQFLEKLKDQGASLAFARQLVDYSVVCLPEFNPSCPARVTEVAALMVTEAEYPAEKN